MTIDRFVVDNSQTILHSSPMQITSRVTVETLKSLRGTEDDLAVWEILNCCEEELLLTEKQLHSINLSADDPQIPFTDLRLALESIWNVRVGD